MTDFIFSKQNLVKSGMFREILQTKIHLETAQKLTNDHLAGEVSNNPNIFLSDKLHLRFLRFLSSSVVAAKQSITPNRTYVTFGGL